MAKIKVANPVVELDGDEMSRIIWQFIRNKLILPYLDVELHRFDLGIQHRDATGDQVTADAADAIARHGVGVKCATIGPDEARVEEFNLKAMYRSPDDTIREALGGVVFREPVVLKNVPRPVPRWTKPVVVARGAFGDQYRATDLKISGPGTLTMTYLPEDGSDPVEVQVHAFPGPGVAIGMADHDASVRDFARGSFRYALARGLPVVLSTRNTVFRRYDGRFKDLFQEVFDADFATEFDRAGLTYEHRPVEDMAAAALASEGGFLWACKNHDGDVQSAAVAQGFGSPGLMTSVLVSADGRTVMAETAHGTVTRHYRRHQHGRATSTDPIASVHAWSRGLAHRGRLDGTPEVVRFAEVLEQVCAETVEGGQMTRDLALLISPNQPWQTTEQFLDTLDAALQKKMADRLPL